MPLIAPCVSRSQKANTSVLLVHSFLKVCSHSDFQTFSGLLPNDFLASILCDLFQYQVLVVVVKIQKVLLSMETAGSTCSKLLQDLEIFLLWFEQSIGEQ